VEVKLAGRKKSKKCKGVTKVGEVKILLLPPEKELKKGLFLENWVSSPTEKWQEVENKRDFKISDGKIVS